MLRGRIGRYMAHCNAEKCLGEDWGGGGPYTCLCNE